MLIVLNFIFILLIQLNVLHELSVDTFKKICDFFLYVLKFTKIVIARFWIPLDIFIRKYLNQLPIIG